MTTMESPQIQVTSYDENSTNLKKMQEDDDDLDKELESFINDRRITEKKDEDNSSTSSKNSASSDEKRESKQNSEETKVEEIKKDKNETPDSMETDIEHLELKSEENNNETREEKKETAWEDRKEEKSEVREVDKKDEKGEEKREEETDNVTNTDNNDLKSDTFKDIDDKKGDVKKEDDDPPREKATDDEDSEPDDYTLTEDQKRALQEIEYLKSEMGLPEEDPPEYDVKERLKTINEELANDPTPIEKNHSKVNFKANLVDLVAPPPDYPEDETTPRQDNSETAKSDEQEKSTEKNGNKNNNGDKVLVEIDGKFDLIDSNDVRAKELGVPIVDSEEIENANNNSVSESNNSEFNRKPAPPSQPRPSTATGSSLRSTRPGSSKQRASSAGSQRGSLLGDFTYNSPYAMSPQDKKLAKEQADLREKRLRDKKRMEEKEKEYQEQENNDAFQAWLRQKREEARIRRQKEEEERKKNAKSQKHSHHDNNSSVESYESLPQSEDQEEEIKEAYSSWVKRKQQQQKQEKLLKRRQEMESTDGFYIRTRQECDSAFRQWLRHKNSLARKKHMEELQRSKLNRIASRKSRKNQSNLKAIKQSNAFLYVDYYGYRY